MNLAAAALAAALAVAGCATLEPSARLESPVPALRDCAAWFRDLDARIDAAGVRDGQAARITGYPYLRASRFLASFREAAQRDDAARVALIARMQALDLQARRAEIGNLGDPPEELERARECGTRLASADLADAGARAQMLDRVAVPDDYSTAMRGFGLYALTQIPFSAGVRRYRSEVLAAHRLPLRMPEGASLLTLSPAGGAPLARDEVAAILRRASEDPLGIPEPPEAALAHMFETYAPIFEIEVAGDDDRPGALRWVEGRGTPFVDAADPVVYRLAAWTRDGERSLLQLVYVLWFPARPPQSDGDLLSGALDGVVWRVTLAPDGEPLLYDTIHPCGCYHLFYPTPLVTPRPAPEDELEWMLAPQPLPRIAEGERVRVRIAARTHYVERVTPVSGPAAGARYAMASYDALRSLPLPGGGHRSLFASDGIVPGTERAERYWFWPMGISSAGAMRQWGREPTAFVGRQHFDDADLMAQRFVLAPR
ncbi:MAG: hypothetical protein ACREVQ_04025 [Burkholderiales bacterium]